MPSGIKNNPRLVRPAGPSATALPGVTADAAPLKAPDAPLSAAFRHALGGRHGDSHPAMPPLQVAREVARHAKAEKPGAPRKGTPGKTHIGPRSGHK